MDRDRSHTSSNEIREQVTRNGGDERSHLTLLSKKLEVILEEGGQELRERCALVLEDDPGR